MPDSFPRTDGKMMSAFRNHHLVVGKLLRKDRFAGERILRINPLRDIFLAGFPNRIGRFIEMAHEGLAVAERDNIQIQNARPAKRLSATVKRGPGSENVI